MRRSRRRKLARKDLSRHDLILRRSTPVAATRLAAVPLAYAAGDSTSSSTGLCCQMRRIAIALHLEASKGRANSAQIFAAQFNGRGAHVLRHSLHLGRAGDRHDPRLLCEQPGQRDLGGSGILRRGYRGEQIDESLICLACLRREPRQETTEVVLGKGCRRIELSREEASAERTVWYESDGELLAGRHDLLLRITPPQRVFALQSRHGLHGV